MTTVSLDEVTALADQLPTADQLRLVERVIHNLVSSSPVNEKAERYDWMALRGIAPGLLSGEDAQAWVSRTRQEADERRENSMSKIGL